MTKSPHKMSLAKKAKQYEKSRRYREDWEAEFAWVREAPDHSLRAYCIICKVTLRPKKSCLICHEKTRQHLKSAGMQEGVEDDSVPPPAEEPPPLIYSMSLTKYWQEKADRSHHLKDSEEDDFPADLTRLGFSLPSVEVIPMSEMFQQRDYDMPKPTPVYERPTEMPTSISQDGGGVLLRDKAQHSKLDDELQYQLKSASRFDTLWYCKDGCYKVHKAIVAIASPFLRQILEQEPDEQISVIFTPDFNSSVIKPIIYLFYTGNVNVDKEMIAELKMALQIFEFNSDNITVALHSAQNVPDTLRQEYFMSAMDRNGSSLPITTKRKRSSQNQDYSSNYDAPLLYGDRYLYGSGSEDDDWGSPQKKRSKVNNAASFLKCELFSEEEEEDKYYGGGGALAPAKKKKLVKKKAEASNSSLGGEKRGRKKGSVNKVVDYYSDEEDMKPERKKIVKSKPRRNEGEEEWPPGDGKENGDGEKKPSWKFLAKADTSERYRTRGSGKDIRALHLSEKLFQGQHLDFIYVCISCYSVFDSEIKLDVHKEQAHPGGVGPGDLHTDQTNEYQCPKCRDVIAVKHLAWFCKHLKYCGVDNDVANDVVTPGEDSSDCDDETYFGQKRIARCKNTPERLQIVGGRKGRNVQILSKVLCKKLVKFIWGCNLCYGVFLSQEDLDAHKEEKHIGEDLSGHGIYWNPTSQNYSCPHCKKIQNSRHLVWFIYHLHKCKMASSDNPFTVPKIDINAEDDSDEEDNNEDVLDPEGILFRTYKVKGKLAEWICEALFGRILEQLYPCHVCYTVHPTAQELQSHFLSSHPNLLNRLENGAYYKKSEQCFSCPICLNNVCNKKTNSIFFTYHFRKCNHQTFPVQRKCQSCNKVMNSYSTYRDHLERSCNAKNFMCHICTKCFINKATLNHHIKYVHRPDRPYQCHLCDKNYKADSELKVHIKTSHSLHYNYSCEKCGKQFYGKKRLTVHMAGHLPEAERKYGCSICGKRFSKKKILENHITTHSAVRQFACEICGARVKTRDTLKQHRKKVHKIFTPAPKQKIVTAPELENLDVKEEVVGDPFGEDESACAAIMELAS